MPLQRHKPADSYSRHMQAQTQGRQLLQSSSCMGSQLAPLPLLGILASVAAFLTNTLPEGYCMHKENKPQQNAPVPASACVRLGHNKQS